MLYMTWDSLLKAYASCNLTYGKDKLVAINGVMQRIAKWTGRRSVAGMWQEWLPIDLLWYGGYRYRKLSATSIYRGLSWSSASTDGGIYNDYYLAANIDTTSSKI